MHPPHLEIAAAVKAELIPLGNPERATQEKRYLKSDLEHLGVATPVLRRVVREALRAYPSLTRDELLALLDVLWTSRVHELRAAALESLERKLGLLEAADLELVERLLRESRSWAYVDFLSVHIAGRLVQRWPELAGVLDRWASDPDFWVRRAAMLTLLEPLRRGGGDLPRFLRFADTMLEEREFFIRKAIGWVLREIAEARPEDVVSFLEPRLDRVAGLTLREATRHLPAEIRETLLRRRATTSRHARHS